MHSRMCFSTVNILLAGVRLVDLRGVCDRFLLGVHLGVRPVFFLTSALRCFFLSGVLTRVLACLLGVDRRGDDRVFEVDS